MKLYHILFALILLSSCAPIQKVVLDTSRRPLSDSTAVAIADVKQPMPDSCKLIGTLLYQGSSRNLSYDQLMVSAKREARLMGGNLVKVTDMPLDGSTPLHISILYRQNIKDIDSRLKVIRDSLRRLKFGDNPSYAILYIYRPSTYGALMGYKIRVDDKVIGKSRAMEGFQVKLYKEGTTTIEAHTETSASTKIDVKFGEEYYLKCGIQMGFFVGEPWIEIIPDWKGSMEYKQFDEANKNTVIAKDSDDN